ncbi:MAG: hypothetical protein IJ275_03095, partial [Ruminococcus sp.]|nr:hypothetical protein [Ruminococcus sp.]
IWAGCFRFINNISLSCKHFIGIYADIIMNFLSPNIGFVRKIKVVYLGEFLSLLIEDILKQVC